MRMFNKIAALVALFVVLGSSSAFAGAGGGGGPAPTLETLAAQLDAQANLLATLQTQQALDHVQIMNLRKRVGELEKQNAQLKTDIAYVYTDVVPAIDGQLNWLVMTGKAKGEQINWLASLVEENYNWIGQNKVTVGKLWGWYGQHKDLPETVAQMATSLNWSVKKLEALDAFSIPLMSKNIDQLLANMAGMQGLWTQVSETVKWAKPLIGKFFPTYGPNGEIDFEIVGSLSVTGKIITLKGAAINGETVMNGPVKWIEWVDDLSPVYRDVSDWFECNVYSSQTGEDCVLK